MKAARQLGVIMGAFMLCFCPYFFCFIVVAFYPLCIDSRLMIVVAWVVYLNSTLNPLLYPLCNVQFRNTFRRMMHIRRGCNWGRRGGSPGVRGRHPKISSTSPTTRYDLTSPSSGVSGNKYFKSVMIRHI